MFKKMLRFIVGALLLALLILPVGALYALSAMEQEQFNESKIEVELTEFSYGIPSMVRCLDISETITLSGTVISTQVIYQELDVEDPALLRLLVSTGKLLQEGDLIGYYQGEALYATQTGVIRSIGREKEAYIELWSLDALAIECYVTDTQLKVLQRGSLALSDNEGNTYTVSQIDSISIGNTNTRVLLTSDTAALTYGKTLSQLTLNTGRVYPESTVVESRCIFSLDDGITYYVRLVDMDGNVLGLQQVEVGVTVGSYTCVTGVEEGQFCDPAYKSIVEG